MHPFGIALSFGEKVESRYRGRDVDRGHARTPKRAGGNRDAEGRAGYSRARVLKGRGHFKLSLDSLEASEVPSPKRAQDSPVEGAAQDQILLPTGQFKELCPPSPRAGSRCFLAVVNPALKGFLLIQAKRLKGGLEFVIHHPPCILASTGAERGGHRH